jgi:hypothetical protein
MKTKQDLLAEIQELRSAIEESTSDVEIEMLYSTLEDVKTELRNTINW